MKPCWGLAALALTLSVTGASPGSAQQPESVTPRVPPDTVAVSPAEELRRMQLGRLARLSRMPGDDTLGVEGADSLNTAVAAVGATGTARPPGGVVAGDSVMRELVESLHGYQPVQYQGRSARFESVDRNLLLHGDTLMPAGVVFEGQQVRADSTIRFSEVTRRLVATGRPVYTPVDGSPVESDLLIADTEAREASAFGAETQYQQGGQWRVIGDLPRLRSDVIFGSHTRFTSCTLEEPHYHFETDQLKIVAGNILVARPVRLYFADVPVAWLPFIAQSLASGRSSGLLTPRFSINDIVRSSGGYKRRVSNIGFYWAMSDYTDATVAFDWFSDNYTALTGSVRYTWLRQFMNGSVNFRRYWPVAGGSQFSLNAQHAWQVSERTSMRASVNYSSSSAFVRQYSYDPREVTQEIRSDGGFNHRFSWGNLSLSANRSQSLSDDRVNMTLPSANLSLSTVTLFPAPVARASWYNNLTWSGGVNYNRRTRSMGDEPADAFSFARADNENARLGVNHRLSFGRLSLSQSLDLDENTFLGVPDDAFGEPTVSPDPFHAAALRAEGETMDIAQATLSWRTGLSYQQNLIGSTTLTPSVSISGSALRSDTLSAAQSFVAAPSRLTLGAGLKGDLYGFFPGFGPFEAVRHKVSPSFQYDWAPEVEPTEVQREVFGARTLQPQSALTIGLSQTFEAKRRPPEPGTGQSEASAPGGEAAPGGASEGPQPDQPSTDPRADPLVPSPEVDTAQAVGGDQAAPQAGGDSLLIEGDQGPQRQQQSQVVTLLRLSTNMIAYDFVQADSAGDFLQGFTTTQIRTQIQSDYLRGLSVSFAHDLWKDSTFVNDDGLALTERSFSPHLWSLNLGFSLSGQSALFRWLGLGGAPDALEPAADSRAVPLDAEPGAFEDPFGPRSATDETGIVPGAATDTELRDARARRQGRQDWSANFTYSLIRPRRTMTPSQNLSISLTMSPTEHWDMSWRTAYDLERRRFNDHMVRLTRDLHRWQANFDFMKTATGNWTFRFEVSLLDNRDLKFDYQQRNLEPPR